MPLSYAIFKTEIKEYIKSNEVSFDRILDIGAGVGTYADLLNDCDYTIDGIEIYTPYVEIFNLVDKYDTLFIADVRKQTKKFFDKYGVIILGDVLEHMSIDEAKELLSKMKDKIVIIAVPFKGEQGVAHGNENEIHYQDDLTPQLFVERYTNFYPLCIGSRYGVFVNRKESFYYTTNDLSLETLSFLNNTYDMQRLDAYPELYIYSHDDGMQYNVPKEYSTLLKEYPL